MDKIDSHTPKVTPVAIPPVAGPGKSAAAKGPSSAVSVEHAAATASTQRVSELPTLPTASSKLLPSTYEKTVQRVEAIMPQVKVDLATILELLTKLNTQMYTSERIANASELTSQLQAMESKKKSLNREAAAELAAGIIRGAFEIASGVINFAGSVKMGRLMRNNPEASDMTLNAKTMRLSMVASGLGQGVSASGTMGSSIAAYVGQTEKGKQVTDDEQATKAQSMQEVMAQSAQQAMSTFESINNILRSVIDARHEVAEKSYY